jgi:hypothetical protein
MSIFRPLAEEDQNAISEWFSDIRAEMAEIAREKSVKYSFDFLQDEELLSQNGRFLWENKAETPKVKQGVRRSSASSTRSTVSTVDSVDELSEDFAKIHSLSLNFANYNSDRHAFEGNEEVELNFVMSNWSKSYN